MKKKLLFLILIAAFGQTIFGQIQFQKIYSGLESEWATEAIECAAGGYAILGTTRSFGAGMDDISLIKTNANGEILWANTVGGPQSDYCSGMAQTPDGGFIIVGYTFSFGALGTSDVYVVRVSPSGEEIWSKVFHGANIEQPQSVKNAANGGFIIAGFTRSFGVGNKDYFLLKLNESGDITWSKTYGKGDVDDLYSLELTDDGGYIMAGGSGNFDPTGSNVNIIKTDETGDTLWTKAYRNERPASIGFSAIQTSDGGYIIGAYAGEGYESEYYVIRTDAIGDTIWTKNYSITYCDDWCRSIRETADGNFIMSGYSVCVNGIFTVKIDGLGDVIWSKQYTGLFNNTRIEETTDNGLLMLTWDYTDDFGYDIRLVKTNEDGISGCDENILSTVAQSTFGHVQSGAVSIDNCPWEVVEPATVSGIASYVDTTICISCDSITADFNFEVAEETIDFTDLSIPSTEWSWDFGDGTTSDVQNPSHTYALQGTYMVCLTASNPICGEDVICKEITIEVDDASFAEEDQETITIFPNPSQAQFMIQSSSMIGSIKILSLSGQLIFTNESICSTKITLDMQDLPKGIYIAEILTERGLIIKKIIRN